MKYFLSALVSAIVLVAGFIVLTEIYLGSDNLAECSKPSTDKSSSCRKADAIVVVSGGDTVSRTDKAIAVWKAGYADKIIFSGASANKSVEPNAVVMERRARKAGIPAAATYVEQDSRDTRENAKNSVKILKKIGARDVILVSSSYHLRRVRMNFERQDRSIAYRTIAANDDSWSSWYLKPSGWRLVLTEWGGILALLMGVTVK